MKNGFTLVELLAVIVILAVLALIATPVVLSIIDDTKESAMLRSAEMYLSGVENAVMRENMNSGGNFRPNECTISNGNMTCGTTNVEVEVDGEVPSTGAIVFENGKIKEVILNYETGTIIKDSSGNLVYEGSQQSFLPGGMYVDGVMTVSWQELIDEELFSVNDGIMQGLVTNKTPYPEGDLVIDSSVKIIGSIDQACHGLPNKIIIQNSVEEIRGIGNSYLPVGGIYIPKSVKSISSGAMSAKEGIIYYEGSEEEWLNIIDPNDIYFSEDYFDITFNYVLE